MFLINRILTASERHNKSIQVPTTILSADNKKNHNFDMQSIRIYVSALLSRPYSQSIRIYVSALLSRPYSQSYVSVQMTNKRRRNAHVNSGRGDSQG